MEYFFNPLLPTSSSIVALNSLVLEKKKRGEHIYDFGIGEPLVPTHKLIVEAAIAALQAEKTHYPPVQGIPELREAVALWLNNNYQTSFSSKNILISCGGKGGLALLFQALLRPGDEVLLIAPYWVSYSSMVQLVGGIPRVVETKELHGWKPTRAALEVSYSARTKVLCINNAANPTGVTYTREELSEVLDFAKEKNLLVISDEVYSGLVYDDNVFVSCGSFFEHRERVVLVQSCSKHFAMTGWRVGVVAGPEPVIQAIGQLQGQSTSGTSSISQWAAVAAFTNGELISGEVRAIMEERRNIFCNHFKQFFGGVLNISAGLYALVPLHYFNAEKETDTAFCARVLTESAVALVPGTGFGAEGYVRFSFGGLPPDSIAGLEKLAAYVQNK